MFSSKRYLIVPVLFCCIALFGVSEVRAQANNSPFDALFSGLQSISNVLQNLRTTLSISADTQLASVAASDLVAYYSFDEGEGDTLNDSSGRGNDGDINGATWTNGVSGSALRFDGSNDFVDLGDASVFDLDSAHTISAWVKVSSNQNAHIFSHGSAGCCGTEYGLMVHQSNSWSDHSFKLIRGGSSDLSSDGPVALNVWKHVVATWDGNTMRIYENGVEKNSRAQSGSIAEFAKVTTIGALRKSSNSSGSEFFHGEIDELRVYSSGLSAKEVKALYNNPNQVGSTVDVATKPDPAPTPTPTSKPDPAPTPKPEPVDTSDPEETSEPAPRSSNVSPLQELAESMEPGTFAELDTVGLTDGFMKSGCSSPITSFTDSAVWDPVGRNFLLVGGPHGCPHSFAQYAEDTNSWTKLPTYNTGATHAYDHNTIDADRRTYWFRKHNQGGIHSYDMINRTWTLNAVPDPSSSNPQVSGGLKFFPEMDRLVHINWTGGGEVQVYENGGWTEVGDVDMGRRDVFSEYNPVHGHILFGGGMGTDGLRKNLYTLNSDRSITTKDVSKVPVTFFTAKTIVTVDPVSGNYLVFDDAKVTYEYDAINDSWRTLNNLDVPFYEVNQYPNDPVSVIAAAPVTNHGVIMFLQHMNTWQDRGPTVWLYKHAEGDGTTPPAPRPSVSFVANPETTTEGASTNLIWSALYADECTASGGWSGVKSVVGMENVSPNETTTYTLSCSGVGGTTVVDKTVVVQSADDPIDPQPPIDAYGDCSTESMLSGRDDVVFCESWESETWWSDHEYIRDGSITNPQPVNPTTQLEYASITNEGCISGNCLELDTPEGVTRSLSVHWPLANAGVVSDEAYMRYYIKLGDGWDPRQCESPGNEIWPPSGKLPGLADPRTSADPGGQCGNGGAASNGIDCWSARGVFSGCEDTGDRGFPYANSCEYGPDEAMTHIGNYVYHAGQKESTGSNAHYDFVPYRQQLGDDFSSACWRDDPLDPDPACYDSPNNMVRGIGTGGIIESDKWYAVEMQVKMNTPGQADGVLRGWVDGVLSYDKTDMEWRYPGHDDLHVRNVWLNVYKGGVSGNCADGKVFLDNLVVATERPIGPVDTVIPPAPKFSLNDRVEVNTGDGSSLNVRVSANGVLLGTQPDGAPGTVRSGLVEEGGYIWWDINFDTGVDGWVAQDFIEEIDDLPSVEPPEPTNTDSIISNIVTDSGRAYTTDVLSNNNDVYVDRTYEWRSLPDEYEGYEYILTANSDKVSSGNSFLSFDVEQDVTILIAYDVRESQPPSWMSSWTEVGEQLQTTDTNRDLYAKDFSAGTVTLGGNGGASSMYSVIIIPNGTSDTGNDDLDFMRSCFFQTAVGDCASADFNNDGIINFIDLGELKSTIKYDLSGDQIVDLATAGDDLEILQTCFSNSSDDCVASDFNGDGEIDDEDLVLFETAARYDLSGDSLVDLRED